MKTYYSDNKEQRDYNINYFNNMKGSHSKVYRIAEDACLKRFLYPWDVYDKNMFYEYMNLELDNYYKIYELLYNKYGKLAGYVMEYYNNTVENIIDMPSDYITDNFDKIYASIKKISNKNIIINDLIPTNFIFDDNKITVIDIDNYKLRQMDNNILKRSNEISMCVALYRKLKADILTYYCDDFLKIYLDNLNNLFNTNEYIIVTKTLSKYKYPIDYLSKRTSGRNI